MANVFGGISALKISAISGAGCTAATAMSRFVKFSADNTVVPCTATTDIACGVLEAPCVTTGDPVTVVVVGEVQIQASTTITAGQPIAPNASGQAQTAVAAQYVVGVAVNVAGATTAGTLITALVNCANPTVV